MKVQSIQNSTKNSQHDTQALHFRFTCNFMTQHFSFTSETGNFLEMSWLILEILV
jgi:hypothetical protein